MGQTNLHASLDFFWFCTSRLFKFACSPQQTTCDLGPSINRGIKIVGQIKQISTADRNLFKELKEPKRFLTQSFCKNEETKHENELKLWGVRGGGNEHWPMFNWENLEPRRHQNRRMSAVTRLSGQLRKYVLTVRNNNYAVQMI